MLATGEEPSRFRWYMEMLKDDITPSVGFGIGVQRQAMFVCGFEAV